MEHSEETSPYSKHINVDTRIDEFAQFVPALLSVKCMFRDHLG